MSVQFLSASTQYAYTVGDAIGGLSAFSHMAWARTNTLGSNYRTIGSQQINGTGNETCFIGSSNSNNWAAILSTTGTSENIISGPVLTQGKWTHIAQTWDGVTHRLYVDGVQQASSALTGTILTTTSPYIIGANNDGGTLAPLLFWDGLIEDLRLYNRGLSANEIKTIFTTQGGDGIVSGLFARYPLNTQGGTGVITSIPEIAGKSTAMQIAAVVNSPTSNVSYIRGSRSRRPWSGRKS